MATTADNRTVLDRIEAIIASLSVDEIKDRLADFHDGSGDERGEAGDWREWARCWAIDSLHEGVPAVDVLAVIGGES